MTDYSKQPAGRQLGATQGLQSQPGWVQQCVRVHVCLCLLVHLSVREIWSLWRKSKTEASTAEVRKTEQVINNTVVWVRARLSVRKRRESGDKKGWEDEEEGRKWERKRDEIGEQESGGKKNLKGHWAASTRILFQSESRTKETTFSLLFHPFWFVFRQKHAALPSSIQADAVHLHRLGIYLQATQTAARDGGLCSKTLQRMNVCLEMDRL